MIFWDNFLQFSIKKYFVSTHNIQSEFDQRPDYSTGSQIAHVHSKVGSNSLWLMFGK